MLDDLTLDRLGKLLGMLGSEHVGERAAAASKAHELLRTHGLDWAALIQLVRASLAADRPQPSQSAHSVPPQPSVAEWHPSPERDGRPGYWARMHDSTFLSVRQCRAAQGYPASWTASVGGQFVKEADGRPVFYASAEKAQLGAVVEFLLA